VYKILFEKRVMVFLRTPTEKAVCGALNLTAPKK
jgi:hypothetical protein